MLKGLSSPNFSPQAAPSHEDLFMQRYERLLRAARRLTGANERAEDLVHNAFVQFMVSRPDIASINDLDGYLVVMLRNLNVSQVRRNAIVQTIALSAAEYDSAETGLRATNAHAQLQVREQLHLICQYACRRKERSKIGSALILRFFHGYYPAEVGQVFRSSRDIVDKWLSLARQEALAYVEDPSSIKLIDGEPEVAMADGRIGLPVSVFLSELRERIFHARSGDCCSEAQLRQIYTEAAPLSTEHLSHIVSCATCLDEINTLLDLPLLAERFPMEAFGRDRKPPGGSGPGDNEGGGMSGVTEIDKLKQLSRRRMTDVLEHRPKELRVAVNGYVLGSQSISAESNKLALSVNLNERVGFVEVFSEQGFCLLFSNVGTPPDGALEQSAHAEFSEGRTLDLNLNFGGPWPTVDVVYNDPTFAPDRLVQTASVIPEVAAPVESLDAVAESAKLLTAEPSKGVLSRIGQAFSSWGFWLRPGVVTLVITAVVLAAFLVVKLTRTPDTVATAADLLGRASAAEDAVAARTDQVVHRTINLVEKKVSGEVLTRRQIDVWQSAQRGVTVRRLYDERGAIVAGDWRRPDGVQTLYHHGLTPRLQPDPEKRTLGAAGVNFENVWQLSPAAKEFKLLIGNTARARVEENASSYSIKYERDTSESSGLINATLVLSRADLHATEQLLTVRQGSEVRLYGLVETSYERRPVSAVAPEVFEPEPELLGERDGARRGAAESAGLSALAPVSPAPTVVTPATEVQVLELLNRAGVFMGDQVTVTRTPGGRLLVSALVDTAERKAEVLRALGPLRGNQAVAVEIQTVAEAEQRQGKSPNKSNPIDVTRVEASEGTSPVYNELRQKFSDDEARRFADRVLSRSSQARSHALALKQLAGRFSLTDLQTLSETEHARWLGLLREHATAYQREIESLRRELQQVFPALVQVPLAPGSDIKSDVEVQQAALQLYQLSVACDEQLRQSFALSADGGSGAPVKTAQFWSSLAAAAALAQQVKTVP